MGPPGHLAIGLAAKPTAPKVPLWVFLLASWFLDILSFGFEAIGLEEFAVTQMDIENGLSIDLPGSVPWSHGLFMSIVWSAFLGAVAHLFFKDKRTSLILGLVVFSHWILDLIVHPPDLPILFEDSPMLGLSLWTSGPGLIASIVLEIALLVGGSAIYFAWRRRESANAFIDKQ